MEGSTTHRARSGTNREPLAPILLTARAKSLLFVVLASLIFLSSCGGSSSGQSQGAGNIAGNWQFTMTPPSDNSFIGGMQGGFLLQKNGSITGAATYSILLPQSAGSPPTLCNGGSAPINGNVSGLNVTLDAVAGNLGFTLTGTLSSDGTTIMGTYTSTDGQGCGTAQTGLQWSATSVPAITGLIQGNFHSAQGPSLRDQDFPVTGTLTQGQNIGASSATVTGTLSFQGYPCLANAQVNGQISGNSVILQIIASNGLNVGQIGAPASSLNPFPAPVTFTSSAGGNGAVLQGVNGYGITTKACPGGLSPGDTGDVCLAVGNSPGCTQPIQLSPASLTFPTQQVGSAPTTQTITLTNTTAFTLNGLSLPFNPQAGNTSLFGLSDFDGLPNFTEQDTCANPPGSTFSLAGQQSCTITISFSPQQSCPWFPFSPNASPPGEPPSLCPFPLRASLTVDSPVSADNDKAFAMPINGMGFSAIVPSVPELDFGAEALTETSAPQIVTFTNRGANPVQILPALNSPCVNPPGGGVLTLPRPLAPGVAAGLQVVTGQMSPNGSTISYNCDSDLTSNQPNFQISADGCSGTLLMPTVSCSLEITFVPQPSTALSPALNYFVELNTLQCTSIENANCEIDAGRFPVELTANLPSPLRMTPGAGLYFGNQNKGQASTPLTLTIFNDPRDPKAATVNFTGNIVSGDYTETDNCAPSLAPGSSCTMTVTFLPKTVGLDPGTITITNTLNTYTGGQTQTVHLWGVGQ